MPHDEPLRTRGQGLPALVGLALADGAFASGPLVHAQEAPAAVPDLAGPALPRPSFDSLPLDREHQPNSRRSQSTNRPARGSAAFRSPARMAAPIFRGSARVASHAWIVARSVFPGENSRSASGMPSI